jgi:hypothetical protein
VSAGATFPGSAKNNSSQFARTQINTQQIYLPTKSHLHIDFHISTIRPRKGSIPCAN